MLSPIPPKMIQLFRLWRQRVFTSGFSCSLKRQRQTERFRAHDQA